MKVVISQPMYIPWPGLFDQIKNADVFVHYDDVQFPQGRSFCSRVQIKVHNKIFWLSVPLIRNSRSLINQTIIDHSKNWKQFHLNKIKEAFAKSPFYNEVINLVQSVFEQNIDKISGLNVAFIETVSAYLELNTKFDLSSKFNIGHKSTEKLLEICKIHKATQYITGHGAKNYLNHELFEENSILVKYFDYQILPYPQDGSFTPYVTILDLIAKKGKDAINYLNSSTVSWKEFLAHE